MTDNEVLSQAAMLFTQYGYVKAAADALELQYHLSKLSAAQRVDRITDPNPTVAFVNPLTSQQKGNGKAQQ